MRSLRENANAEVNVVSKPTCTTSFTLAFIPGCGRETYLFRHCKGVLNGSYGDALRHIVVTITKVTIFFPGGALLRKWAGNSNGQLQHVSNDIKPLHIYIYT